MKINSINIIAFGYNKKLNTRLVERLQSSNDPVNEMVLRVANNCIRTEDSIRALERKGIEKNATAITVMAEYLIPAKTFLAAMVERLFPDLNYQRLERDTYDKEIQARATQKDDFNSTIFKTQHDWREVIADDLDMETLDDEYGSAAYLTREWYGGDADGQIRAEGDIEYDDFCNDAEDCDGDCNNCQTLDNGLKIIDRPDLAKPNNKKDINVELYTPGKNSPKSLDDVIGLDKSIEDIKNFILYPIKYPEKAKEREKDYGIEIPHFIVFHGPPGCGKTMLAEAIAVESGCPMYKVDLSQFGSMYINGTVQKLSKAFEDIYKVSKNSDKPVIVFMDEMDSLLTKRGTREDSLEDNKVVNTLLPFITSAGDNNIVIIGATNMYDSIDSAAKRRIEINAYVGLPNKKDIEKLFVKELSKFKMGENLAQNSEKLQDLSEKFLGYTPSNIVSIVKEASRQAWANNAEIDENYILNALNSGSYERINEMKYKPESMKAKRLGFLTN